MIELEFTGMCKDCKYADLDLDYYRAVDGSIIEWVVSCKHQQACEDVIREHKQLDDNGES